MVPKRLRQAPRLKWAPPGWMATGEDQFYHLVAFGPCPTKKNKLRPRMGKGRAHMYDDETAGAIEDLLTQLKVAWGSRPSVVNPTLQVRMFVSNAAQDQDGIYTTILDVMKKAGILADDSIKVCNGMKIIHPAVIVTKDERRTEILLSYRSNS